MSAPLHDYGSTQVNLPAPVASAMAQLGQTIADDDLAEDGRESQFHCTVLYGLADTGPETLRALADLVCQTPPITLSFGATSFFPASESGSADVCTVSVQSGALVALHDAIAAHFPHVSTHPGYQPHATIAYLQPGKGDQYAGNTALAGQTCVVDTVWLCDRQGVQTPLPLIGLPLAGKKSMDQRSVTLTLTGGPEVLDEILRALVYTEYCCGVGHSCFIGFYADGDGADQLQITSDDTLPSMGDLQPGTWDGSAEDVKVKGGST